MKIAFWDIVLCYDHVSYNNEAVATRYIVITKNISITKVMDFVQTMLGVKQNGF